MQHVLIVGGGLAGHRAAVALRKQGYEGSLTVVGDEAHKPYDRPPLSKQVLAGQMQDQECFFDTEDLGVTWKLGSPAVALDPDARLVRLEAGEELSYDALVIATGRGARPWPEPLDLDGIHLLRSLDDCRRFKGEIEGTSKVVIIGAGFIGCEVAATLRALQVEHVAVVDILPRPMSPLGEEIGDRLARFHEEHGVKLHLDMSVDRFEGQRRVEAVRLTDGTQLQADAVLLAMGSVPNTGWLDGSGVELWRGSVCCDEHLFVKGREDIAVIGDVAAWSDPMDGTPLCVEHWTNAREMGSVAAKNLLSEPGEREVFRTVPTFWSDQYNLKIKSAGFLGRADEFRILEEDREKPSLVAEAYADGELVGAVTINRNRKMIEYTRELAGRATV